MRVSVPTIPDAVLRAATSQSRQTAPALAIDRISTFLSNGKTAVVTGAGVSVDSGIRAYRGEHGVYLNPNYKCVVVSAMVERLLMMGMVVDLYLYENECSRAKMELTLYRAVPRVGRQHRERLRISVR